MLRRVPPAVLALAATVLVAVVVVVLFAVVDGGRGRQLPPCTAAQEAGPYGCVVFVSLDGTVGGRTAAEPKGGAITYRIERRAGRDRLLWTAACARGEAPVSVTAGRYRVGATVAARRDCPASAGPVDRWAAALLTGTIRVDDRTDGTVVLTRGDRRARFAQAVAARG